MYYQGYLKIANLHIFSHQNRVSIFFFGKFQMDSRNLLNGSCRLHGERRTFAFLVGCCLTRLERYEEAASIFKKIRMVKGSLHNQMEVI